MATRLERIGFQTKVLLPVVSVMVLLVAFTIYVVNHRITQRWAAEATQSLTTADAVVQNSQKIRAKNLLLRFENIANEPKYRATCQLADPLTLHNLFQTNLLTLEAGGDLVQYVSAGGMLVTNASRQPALDLAEFEQRTVPSIELAISGTPNVDTIPVSGKLFSAVSVPVKLGDATLGVLTFGVEIGAADTRELSEVIGSEVQLMVNGVPAAGSVPPRKGLISQCSELFTNAPYAGRNSAAKVTSIIVPEEHFWASVGKFDSFAGDGKLGYVLLYSYEHSLRELRATQRTLLLVGLVGILFSTAIVWYLVRKVTQPLRQLRASAEAVGRGDFSQRVEVHSQDECGELATAFNRMTENLNTSHCQLEETVSTLKTTQAQLVQSEKLSAIGEFVAGVTHELNNPLTSLLGFAELLQQTPINPQQKRFVERVANSAKRCQKIVQSLLSFARQHKPERKLTDVNQLVDAVVEIMAYELRTSNIQLIKQLDLAVSSVTVDGHQIQQVFLNIVNNARQAMEGHQSSGKLVAKTEALPGRVRVTFQDNGPGIAEENLPKIFNPFFTTKEAGKGTGLGLSLSYGIIREHGGTITAQSKLGEGAAFIIELPAASVSANPDSANESADTSELVADGKGSRILIVDDEEAILDLGQEVLGRSGYQVDVARDGEAALRQIRRVPYALILSDWKMPGLNGQQMYERLHAEDPNTAERIIFMTGDMVNERTQRFLEDHKKVCLAKPFSLAEFRVAVSKLALAA